jgi:REP element-mobilizing transposase RayT
LPPQLALFFVPTYRRRLPHTHQIGEPLFVTWRLAGSLPENRPFRREDLTDGRAFVVFDRLLDVARTGPFHLRHPEIAGMVANHLMRLAKAEELYDLHAFVLMPNHVHLLLTPNIPFSRIARLAKGATARRANQILSMSGIAFWQDESFDHRVRDRAEFSRVVRYIEMNPVRAALAAAPESFFYSSASPEWSQRLNEQERG